MKYPFLKRIKSSNTIKLLTILYLLFLAFILLYCDRYTVSNLIIIPDSTEYALAAHRFATAGEYKILVDGQWRSPRYPPWFSIFIISPVYMISGSEPGNAIYPITFFGILGVLMAFFIGKRAGGYSGGIFASLLLLSIPIYRDYSKYIMTEVPATVIFLIACLSYMSFKDKTNIKSYRFLIPGILIALGSSFRPVNTFAILPFMILAVHSFNILEKIKRILYLSTPLFFIIIATFIYNYRVFGSIFRTGYHFWTSVPFDYACLTFSHKYITVNIIMLFKSQIFLLFLVYFVFLLIGYKIILNKKDTDSSDSHFTISNLKYILEFTLLATGPMILFYILYFYPSPRFYLPPLALAAVSLGIITGKLFDRYRYFGLLILLILITTFQLITNLHDINIQSDLYKRRLTVNEILRNTPENSWIISAIEPAYLEYLLFISGGAKRRVVPVSRNIEYADKLIIPKKILYPHPPPKSWRDHRCYGLIKGGAEEAVKIVASEQINLIAQKIALGHPVFLTTTNIPQQDIAILKELEKRFIFKAHSKNLIELKKR